MVGYVRDAMTCLVVWHLRGLVNKLTISLMMFQACDGVREVWIGAQPREGKEREEGKKGLGALPTKGCSLPCCRGVGPKTHMYHHLDHGAHGTRKVDPTSSARQIRNYWWMMG